MKVVKSILLNYTTTTSSYSASVWINFDVKFIHVKGIVYSNGGDSGTTVNYRIIYSDMTTNQPLGMVETDNKTDTSNQNVLIEFLVAQKIQGVYNFWMTDTTGTLSPGFTGTDKVILLLEFFDSNAYPPRIVSKSRLYRHLGNFRASKIVKPLYLTFNGTHAPDTIGVHVPFMVKFIHITNISYVAVSAATTYVVVTSDLTNFQPLGLCDTHNNLGNNTCDILIEFNVATKVQGYYNFFLINMSGVFTKGTGTSDYVIVLAEFYDDSASPVLIRNTPVEFSDIPGKINVY